MQPRCLKCGKNHATRNCLIKERQENPFCINFQDYGHSACYTKCPKFPQPKKGTPFGDPKKKIEISPLNGLKREFLSLTLLAAKSPIRFLSMTKKRRSPHGFLSQDSNNTSDLTQVLELFQIISNLVKKNPKILDLLTKFKKAKSDEEKPAFSQKCDTPKKDLVDNSESGSNKGPDIIPLSIDPDAFRCTRVSSRLSDDQSDTGLANHRLPSKP
ncbi:uncharacterized protein TNCV_2724331 [Trichonephila clavipes]|nr:uncharacterized protein TNCV_2724331 [Trichonephila clavipes]